MRTHRTKKDSIKDLYYRFYTIDEIASKTETSLTYVKSIIQEIKPREEMVLTCYTKKQLNKLKNKIFIGDEFILSKSTIDHRMHRVVNRTFIEKVKEKYPYIVLMESGRSYQYIEIANAIGEPRNHKFNELEVLDYKEEENFYYGIH